MNGDTVQGTRQCIGARYPPQKNLSLCLSLLYLYTYRKDGLTRHPWELVSVGESLGYGLQVHTEGRRLDLSLPIVRKAFHYRVETFTLHITRLTLNKRRCLQLWGNTPQKNRDQVQIRILQVRVGKVIIVPGRSDCQVYKILRQGTFYGIRTSMLRSIERFLLDLLVIVSNDRQSRNMQFHVGKVIGSCRTNCQVEILRQEFNLFRIHLTTKVLIYSGR